MEHEHQNPFAGIKWHEQAVYDSLGAAAQQLGPRHDLPQHPREAQPAAGAGLGVGSRLDHGVRVRARAYRRARAVRRQRPRPAGVLSKARQGLGREVVPADEGQGRRRSSRSSPSPSISPPASRPTSSSSPPRHASTPSRRRAPPTPCSCSSRTVDGGPRYLAGDDDSGEDRNASVTYKLFKGRTYTVRLRLYYPGQTGTTSLMLS